MGTSYGQATPLQINQNSVWKGRDRSNGFVMRNADGRVPAITEGFTRLGIGASNVLYPVGAVPYGNALFRDTNQIDTAPGLVFTDKPTKSWFVGILEFEQSNQTGNPILNWAKQLFQRGNLVRSGYVGYKQTMVYGNNQAHYLDLLTNGLNSTYDTTATRLIYADMVAAFKAGADGDRLGLFFDTASGFPIAKMVVAANLAAPLTGLTGVVFAGYAEIFEKENEAVIFRLRDAGALTP
jgi:hypothetical protein